MTTVIHQSYKTEGVPAWIDRCLATVREWAASRGFEYRFAGDEIFDSLPADYRAKAAGRMPILSDLARLIMARNLLEKGFKRTIWIDADVLVFDPDEFDISVEKDFSFCREVWIQPDAKGRLKAYRNVHNAVSVFLEGNSFLEFYIDACQRIVGRIEGEEGLVNQIVGPKFLGSLHNTLGYPVIENVGMLSPRVISDIDQGGGTALEMLIKESPIPMQAANLCSSLVGEQGDGVDLSHEMVERVVDSLLGGKGGLLSRVGR